MKRSLLTAPFFVAAVVACGGAGVPAAGPDRESGQSALMGKTLAGANKCDPKAHDRPFVIEWDATDMSSFEAKASNDVIFVKYEGCDLKVLDGCSNDSVKGALGSYGPPEWTSGSVEKVDIANEGELYAKLPLGVNTLSGRVQAGEQFHMEYYVSGTRKATRDEVYRKDIDAIPRCKGATHFVYAYNLGAFALGSAKQINASAGGTVWGIGAGGSSKSVSNAEKKGGVLTSCTGETAKETATCKVPIRLTLREISDGDNPDAVAAVAPETPNAMNLAGKVDTKIKMKDEARSRLEAAIGKMNAHDGKSCVKELNAYDKLEPKYASTSASSQAAFTRASCVMLSGMCDAGKSQYRKAFQTQQPQQPPETVDMMVDAMAAQFCQGASMSPRDQLLKAARDLNEGARAKKDAAFCKSNYDTVKRLSASVQPKDDDDFQVKSATNMFTMGIAAGMCLGRAGDCDAAYKANQEGVAAMPGRANMQVPERQSLQNFANNVKQCKDWVASRPVSAADQAADAKSKLRDDLGSAFQDLQKGSQAKSPPGACKRAHDKINTLLKSAPNPNDPTLMPYSNQQYVSQSALACYVKAGECDDAWKAFLGVPVWAGQSASTQKQIFESQAPGCKK